MIDFTNLVTSNVEFITIDKQEMTREDIIAAAARQGLIVDIEDSFNSVNHIVRYRRRNFSAAVRQMFEDGKDSNKGTIGITGNPVTIRTIGAQMGLRVSIENTGGGFNVRWVKNTGKKEGKLDVLRTHIDNMPYDTVVLVTDDWGLTARQLTSLASNSNHLLTVPRGIGIMKHRVLIRGTSFGVVVNFETRGNVIHVFDHITKVSEMRDDEWETVNWLLDSRIDNFKTFNRVTRKVETFSAPALPTNPQDGGE